MQLDVSKIPFSYPGSYFAINRMGTYEDEPEGLYIRSLHKDVYRQRIARLVLLHNGTPVPFAEEASPTSLTLRSEFGSAAICYEDPTIFQVQAEKVTIRFEFIKASHVIPYGTKACEVNSDGSREHIRLISVSGKLIVNTSWNSDNADYVHIDFAPSADSASVEGVLELFRDRITWNERTYSSFADSLQAVTTRYNVYEQTALQLPERYSETRQLAVYLNWMVQVRPYENITRPTMYASKSGMCGIWSWDHCFHAMAVAEQDPELAWHQWMLVFDHQDPSGALPDTITDNYLVRGYVKPPIHGFALRWMMEQTEWITNDHLLEAYPSLVKWTEWWFNHRDSDKDGMPEYHNGNDCGWDNSTIFADGIPLESPDLATYLILQMDTLAIIAKKLGMLAEANGWKVRSERLLDNLLEHFVHEGRLKPRRAGSHEFVESKSLILYLPLLLGEKLPKAIRDRMIEELKVEGAFLTKYGLASERLDSGWFEEDGYWRGPIWAPPMFLLSHALRELGEQAFSRDLAERFCDLVAMSGMAENFHAKTGQALRDPGITWTSSIFLMLGSKYV
jgi:hypothetical protein